MRKQKIQGRLLVMVIGLITIAEGLTMIFTLGSYYPQYSLDFLIWNMNLKPGGKR